MNIELHNKTVLITGSSKGIGAAIAREMAKAGARVVLHGRDEDQLVAVAKEINAIGGNTLIAIGDLALEETPKEIFNLVEDTWGSVDILVNNAAQEIRKSTIEFTSAEYDHLMQVNLKAAFICAQMAIPNMKKKKWGRIINISSLHELQPTGYSSVYSISKGGLFMMMREMAVEFSKFGLTINNIAPGAIRTDMNKAVLSDAAYEQKVIANIPAGFIGLPEDIAGAAVFLASDYARYITGSSLYVDGGLVL